jgi:uncharacterized protein
MKQLSLVGRVEEKSILQSLLQKQESQFLAIYGRRRVGKTYLIRYVYKDSIVFETSALHNVEKQEQIENFWEDLLKKYNPKEVMPKSWKRVFITLEQYLDSLPTPKGGKKVIFIDEIPWYDTPKSGFLPAFTAFWNGYCSKKTDILLVICGSAASWIIKKVINDKGGLHNRITRSILLKPFDITETTDYLKEKNIKLSPSDTVVLFMIIGGIPHYLNQIEKGQGIPEILNALFFSKTASLIDEYKNLYPALFKNHEKHIDILQALSKKQKGLTRDEIIAKSKFASGGWLTETLDELEQCGFIMKTNDFTKPKSDGLFRIVDEFSIFFMRFLVNKDRNQNGVVLYNSQKFKIWLGLAFENFCFRHHDLIVNALGISGINYTIQSYVEKSTPTSAGSQIDIIINREDNYMHLIEAKFHALPYQMTSADMKALIQKRESLITKTKKTIFATLITNIPAIKNEYYNQAISNEILVSLGKFSKV